MMASTKSKKGSGKRKVPSSVGGNKRAEMEVSALMKASITESKKLIKNGFTKAETAREAFDKLSKHERRQVIYKL